MAAYVPGPYTPYIWKECLFCVASSVIKYTLYISVGYLASIMNHFSSCNTDAPHTATYPPTYLFFISAFVEWIAPASPISFLFMGSMARPPPPRSRPAKWAAPASPAHSWKVEEGEPRVLLQHPTQQVHSRASPHLGRLELMMELNYS